MGEGMSENEIPEQLTELLIINARIRELNADHEWRVDWGMSDNVGIIFAMKPA